MFLSSLFKPLKVVLIDQHQSSFTYSHFISLHNIITITGTAGLPDSGTHTADLGEFASHLLDTGYTGEQPSSNQVSMGVSMNVTAKMGSAASFGRRLRRNHLQASA